MNGLSPDFVVAGDDAHFSPEKSPLRSYESHLRPNTNLSELSSPRSAGIFVDNLKSPGEDRINALSPKRIVENSNYSSDSLPLRAKPPNSPNKSLQPPDKHKLLLSRFESQVPSQRWKKPHYDLNMENYSDERSHRVPSGASIRFNASKKLTASSRSTSPQIRFNNDLLGSSSFKEMLRKPSVSQVRSEFIAMHVLRLQKQMVLELNAVEKATLALDNARQSIKSFERSDQSSNFDAIQQVQDLKKQLDIQKQNSILLCTEHDKLVTTLHQQGIQLENLRTDIKETSFSMDQAAEVVHILQKEVENQEAILESERKLASSLPDDVVDEHCKKTTQLNVVKNEFNAISDELAEAEKQENLLLAQIGILQDEIKSVYSDTTSMQSLLADMQNKNLKMGVQIESAKENISVLINANDKKEVNLRSLKESLEALQKTPAEIEEELQESLFKLRKEHTQKQTATELDMEKKHAEVKTLFETALEYHRKLLVDLEESKHEYKNICDKNQELKCRLDESSQGSDVKSTDYDERLETLMETVKCCQNKKSQLESSNQAFVNELEAKSQVHRDRSQNLDDMRKAYDILRSQKEQMLGDITAVEAEVANKFAELNTIDQKITEQVQKFTKKRLDLESEIEKMSTSIENFISSEKDMHTDGTYSLMDTQSLFGDPCSAQYQNTRAKLEQERQHIRELQYRIQERKGSIRVVARIRPLFSENPESAKILVGPYQIDISAKDGASRARSYCVKFDKVFGVDSTNPDVCEEADYILQSTLEGGTTSIMAYGQTGSGKTHTMSSPDGVIRYSLEKLLTQTKAADTTAGVIVEAVEIYNDTIRDLLVPPLEQMNSTQRVSATRSLEAVPRLQSGSDSKSTPVLVGSTRICVETTQAALDVFDRAGKSRKFAATAANARSSRSHFIFSMHIKYSQPKIRCRSGATLSSGGVLHLVDLAGSERLSHSKVVGERLKETNAINSSLSALGTVINALQNKLVYIPYRDSKLTHFLQGALSANAKTMLITALSPEQSSYEETKSTMRFAERVGKVALN